MGETVIYTFGGQPWNDRWSTAYAVTDGLVTKRVSSKPGIVPNIDQTDGTTYDPETGFIDPLVHFYSPPDRTVSVRTDDGGTEPWEQVTTWTDETGHDFYIEVSADNGFNSQSFLWDDGGYVYRFDSDDKRRWALEYTQKLPGEEYTEVWRFNDDGSRTSMWFDGAGVRTGRTQEWANGTFHLLRHGKSWDDAGDLDYEYKLHADGREVVRTFEASVLRSEEVTDQADIFDWTTRTRTWDAEGQLSDKVRIMDAGVAAPDDDWTGRTVTVNEIAVPSAGDAPSYAVRVGRDGDALALIEARVQDDPGWSARPGWDAFFPPPSYGAESGHVEWRIHPETGNIDVSGRFEDWDIGETVVFVDEGDEPWSSTEEVYAENGTLLHRKIVNDNGVVVQHVREFDDGFSFGPIPDGYRVVRTDAADVKDWCLRETKIDYWGQIVRDIRLYDDDVFEVTWFDEGVKRFREEWDVGDVRPFHYRTTDWDRDGDLYRTVAYRDDGLIVEDRYTDGVKHYRSVTDAADAYEWDAIFRRFDELGVLIDEVTILDAEPVRDVPTPAEQGWGDGSIEAPSPGDGSGAWSYDALP